MATVHEVEAFTPTSGRLTGPIGLVGAAVVVVSGALTLDDGFPLPVMTGALVVAALVWAAIVRPRVRIEEHDVVLRNTFATTRVPLAAIESVVVRQLFVVRTSERRYVNASIGRSFREVARGARGGAGGSSVLSLMGIGQALPMMGPAVEGPAGARHGSTVHYVDFVEDRVKIRRDEECKRLGVRLRSSEQQALAEGVRREPAWLEISLLTAATAVFVVSLFLT